MSERRRHRNRKSPIGDRRCDRTGKVTHRSEDVAERIAESMTMKNAEAGQPDRVCRVYHCRHCAFWHVTSKEQRSE